MVDRIVPATTPEDCEAVAAATGLYDAAPVVTERFKQWVVEDDFLAGRPAWEQAGVEFVTDVTPYEIMKLRLLNGSHSAIAYLGLLEGLTYVSDVVAVAELCAAVQGLMTEAAETVPLPTRDYQAALLARFRNPALPHRCAQIAMDGSQKLPQRLLVTIRERLDRGLPIQCLAVAVAAWMRYVAGEDELGRRYAIDDPLAQLIAGCHRSRDLRVRGRALLALVPVFGEDLPLRPQFTEPVLGIYHLLWQRRPRDVVRALARDFRAAGANDIPQS
jgi:fructuronate reductase